MKSLKCSQTMKHHYIFSYKGCVIAVELMQKPKVSGLKALSKFYKHQSKAVWMLSGVWLWCFIQRNTFFSAQYFIVCTDDLTRTVSCQSQSLHSQTDTHLCEYGQNKLYYNWSLMFLTGKPGLPGSPLAPGVVLSLPGAPYQVVNKDTVITQSILKDKLHIVFHFLKWSFQLYCFFVFSQDALLCS